MVENGPKKGDASSGEGCVRRTKKETKDGENNWHKRGTDGSNGDQRESVQQQPTYQW